MKSRCDVATPLGMLRLVAEQGELVELCLRPEAEGGPVAESEPILREACRQLGEYFAGQRRAFDLPLRLAGTPFQEAVWRELQRIPFGTTLSYAELAERIGNAKAVRAVGSANGKNPLPIFIPCHRVIATGGGLGGYGGGLEMKSWLLRHEGAACPSESGVALLAKVA